MSLFHYIDNEVPAFGEWDSVVQSGGSTIVQSADAAFPERGSVGLRCTTTAGNLAYVQKDFGAEAWPAGAWRAIGFQFYLHSPPSVGYTYQMYGKATVAYNDFGLFMYPNRNAKAWISSGGFKYTSSFTFELARWYWIVVMIRRADSVVASNGELQCYINGVPLTPQLNLNNFTKFASWDYVRFGNGGAGRDDYIADFDEIKIADSYPEPFAPTPETEHPEAARTVVLFRRDSSDSREFADYCVSELDIPRSNLCPLPNATANETLADYATFQAEVETDLAAWLALNPTVDANCSCFLIGHGVPGYFMVAGSRYSVASRLMNYGNAFTPGGVTNLLYNPTVVERFTVSGLRATGSYLCSRIDADTLQHAKDILDAGLTVSGLTALPATDKLYSDDSTYRASLTCQHLRIITEGLGVFADDAFVWGDCGTPSFGSAGSRAVFCDDSADSADTLRATSELFDAIVTNGYAAGLGFSASGCSLNAECFFEMLRIGGSLAEAFAVAISKLDYTTVAVGSPVMTVAFQSGGYNVYRGLGGIEGIDWENPIAYLVPGPNSITLAQDLSPGQRYIYAVRAVSSAGIEERNTHVIAYANTDEQGILLPAPLTRPKDPTVEVQQSALLIGFTYLTPIGFADADGFDVLGDNGTGQLDLENPVATVEKSRNDRFDFEVSIARPDTPVLLAVRARRGEQVGPVSKIVFVPLVSAPTSIQIL